MTDIMGDWDLRVAGDPTHYPGDWQVISPEYFRVMGIPLHQGRAFTDADDAHGTQTIIVNEALAHRIWPNGHAVGQQVRMSGMTDSFPRTVVAVVADIRHRGLDADARPEMYLPHAQWPSGGGTASATMYVVVRSARDPRTLAGDVRRTIQSLDPNLPLADVRTMNAVMSGWTAARRLALIVLAMLATTAVVLAAVGLYGVVGYAVSQRTSEIGIRRALGAQAGSVIALVARQGSTPVLLGIVIGIIGAFGASRLIAAMLFQTSAADPIVFLAVPALLTVIAAIATYAPARRAVRVDPIIALRQQ
jgi:putative ABC transport system permease protein